MMKKKNNKSMHTIIIKKQNNSLFTNLYLRNIGDVERIPQDEINVKPNFMNPSITLP